MNVPTRGRVLVVDDKPNMLELLVKILGETYEVHTASDGAAALARLEREGFDVVLTDVRMPGADGFEVVKAVKLRWPHTEVVMMTAYASVEAAVEAIREGAYDYIQKPFDPDDVTLVVARAIERKQRRVPGTVTTQPSGAPDAAAEAAAEPRNLASLSYRELVNQARDVASREYLVALMRAFSGRVTPAAEQAGIERESLHRLLRRYGVRAEDYREGAFPEERK
jgi:DNA-binding NtrC family response regulator